MGLTGPGGPLGPGGPHPSEHLGGPLFPLGGPPSLGVLHHQGVLHVHWGSSIIL